MPWVKIDEGMPEHPKVVGLPPAAKWADIEAICYCARNLTDGRLPGPVAKRIASAKVTAQLVEVGLWDVHEDGYYVHDYLQYNPSREQVLREREKARERMAKARGSSRDVPPNMERTSPNPIRSDSDPTRSDPDQNSLSTPPTPPRKRGRVTVVDDDFRALMCERFKDTWGPERVNEIIDAALGHKAALKWTDQQAGVRNWLSNERERYRGPTNRVTIPATNGDASVFGVQAGETFEAYVQRVQDRPVADCHPAAVKKLQQAYDMRLEVVG